MLIQFLSPCDTLSNSIVQGCINSTIISTDTNASAPIHSLAECVIWTTLLNQGRFIVAKGLEQTIGMDIFVFVRTTYPKTWK